MFCTFQNSLLFAATVQNLTELHYGFSRDRSIYLPLSDMITHGRATSLPVGQKFNMILVLIQI